MKKILRLMISAIALIISLPAGVLFGAVCGYRLAGPIGILPGMLIGPVGVAGSLVSRVLTGRW